MSSSSVRGFTEEGLQLYAEVFNTAWAYVWNENGATHPATSAAQA